MDNVNITYEYRQPSQSELLRIFPESFDYFRERATEILEERNRKKPTITDFKKKLAELEKNYKAADGQIGVKFVDLTLELALSLPENERKSFEYIWLHQFYYGPLERMRKKMRKLKRIIKDDEWKNMPETRKGEIGPAEIAKAKEFPIENLIEVNRVGFAKCPFHNEKNPSFKVYPKENRWYCFSENKGGDIIDLIMEMENLTFFEAVKRLCG